MGEESREEGKVNFYLGTPNSLSINIHWLTFPLSADITTLLLMTILFHGGESRASSRSPREGAGESESRWPFFGYDKSLCSWRRRSSTWWEESKVNLNTLNHASIPRSVCFMYVFRFFSCLNWWLSRRTSWAPLTSRLPPLHPSTPSSQGK